MDFRDGNGPLIAVVDLWYAGMIYEEKKFKVVTATPEREQVGSFSFSPMPGCCGVVVSHTSVYRGALGRQFHALKEYVARQLKYSCMLATTQTANFPELVGGAKSGWRLVEPAFVNTRTGNQLAVMIKPLTGPQVLKVE